MSKNENNSPLALAFGRFKKDKLAVVGSVMIGVIFIAILGAPLLANGKPFFIFNGESGAWSIPALRSIFAPETTETIIEKIFNYLLLFIPLWGVAHLTCHGKKLRKIVLSLLAVLLIVPFVAVKPRLERIDYRAIVAGLPEGSTAIFAPIPYGPYEIVAPPYERPGKKHIFGTDQSGRSVASRMIYGGRVSLAVGVGATVLAIGIGAVVGLLCGYFGGIADLAAMRVVEIFACFPTFLLLLILMGLFQDWKFDQSILIVIGVIGFTGWIGICQLVRGEVLRQRKLSYIQSCVASGISKRRILFVHLPPNIIAPVLVSFTFSVAGAILAESTLSFLGFGVRPPTASWGGLLRQAYNNPFEYWHLTLIPGVALFFTIAAFNFTGEGLRLLFDPKSK